MKHTGLGWAGQGRAAIRNNQGDTAIERGSAQLLVDGFLGADMVHDGNTS